MWVRGKDYRIRRLMYDIDYVFDEMSLFHIEELFDISILSSPPNSVASSNKLTQENFKQTGKRKLGELNHGAQILSLIHI